MKLCIVRVLIGVAVMLPKVCLAEIWRCADKASTRQIYTDQPSETSALKCQIVDVLDRPLIKLDADRYAGFITGAQNEKLKHEQSRPEERPDIYRNARVVVTP